MQPMLCWVIPAQTGQPDQGLPGGQPGYPSQGLPGGQPGHPSQGLPGMPDNSLPGGQPGRPSQGLPGQGGQPSHPIYTPPPGAAQLPSGTSPGAGLWVVAYKPGEGFTWVPISPAKPEQGLPTPQPPTAGTPLPGGPPPKPDQGLPPTAAPKK